MELQENITPHRWTFHSKFIWTCRTLQFVTIKMFKKKLICRTVNLCIQFKQLLCIPISGKQRRCPHHRCCWENNFRCLFGFQNQQTQLLFCQHQKKTPPAGKTALVPFDTTKKTPTGTTGVFPAPKKSSDTENNWTWIHLRRELCFTVWVLTFQRRQRYVSKWIIPRHNSTTHLDQNHPLLINLTWYSW